MRILMLSDVHANPWALAAVERAGGRFDEVLFAGDAVNYGPRPREVIAWLREKRAICARGNHDHAIAFETDPRASEAKQPLALAMRDWTRQQLSPEDLRWLADLPLTNERKIDGVTFAVCHATLADPLFDYRFTPTASAWLLDEIAAGIQADALVLGHTHLPLIRSRNGSVVVNPGSVGQPLDGDPRAAFALWEDGRAVLQRAEYDVAAAMAAVRELPLKADQVEALVHMLRAGRIAERNLTNRSSAPEN